MDRIIGLHLGLKVVFNNSLTETVEDWSDVRSPSRARRRLRSGKRHHPIPHYERPQSCFYRMGDTLFMHQDTWRRMQADIDHFNRPELRS